MTCSACGLAVVSSLALSIAVVRAQRSDEQLPCEAFSQSTAVFIGTAMAPITRSFRFPDQPPVGIPVVPVAVERAYVGVTTPVVYLTPRGGTGEYVTPGRTYLVYGREHLPPDLLMASPGNDAKPIETAGEDLAFLDHLIPGAVGGTISGVVWQRPDVDGRGPTTPLEGVRVRIFSESYSTETVSGTDGAFVVAGLPAGAYELAPQLPDDLVDSTSRNETVIRDNGCARVTINVRSNGRVRGVLRGPDGRPLPSTSVDLIPADTQPDPITGRISHVWVGSVSTNERGDFEFPGRPAGRYLLGVSLYNAPNPTAPSYPRTYYPGTTDRDHAVPIVVERGRSVNGLDFSVPRILPKGELEIVVESNHPGELTFCFLQLEDLLGPRRFTHPATAGVPILQPVVDGQRYEVHAHLEFPGGHLESEPHVFTASTGKTVVTLRPDAPRTLHR